VNELGNGVNTLGNAVNGLGNERKKHVISRSEISCCHNRSSVSLDTWRDAMSINRAAMPVNRDVVSINRDAVSVNYGGDFSDCGSVMQN
jgi:hypothetical protein